MGDAGLGLGIARGEGAGARRLLKRYRLPMPRLEAGRALAPMVSAMMDVSDGLLIDARRMAVASGAAMRIDLDAVPLSPEYAAVRGVGLDARLAAATAGDDYELLFSAQPQYRDAIKSLSGQLSLPLSRIGHVETGDGLTICFNGALVDLPSVLGWEHGDTR